MATPYRKETELIYGIHPILELLKAKKRRLAIIYTTKPVPKAWNLIEPLLPKGIQIQYVDRTILHKMAYTTEHQGFVGYTSAPVIRKKFFDPVRHPRLLMLDGIQDVRNVGAMLRSAYCTGIDGVIMISRGGAPLSAAALKASAGLSEHLEIYQAPSSAAAMQELKATGYHIYLAVVSKGEDAARVSFTQPLCLVIGSEGTGIAKELLSSGTLITLAQIHPHVSYNASVAAGILLFLITQKKTGVSS